MNIMYVALVEQKIVLRNFIVLIGHRINFALANFAFHSPETDKLVQ